MERNHRIKRSGTWIGNMRFQNKLLISYLLACIVPLLIVSVFISRYSAATLEDSSEEFASLYTSQIKSSLNEFIKEYDKVTKSVLVDNQLIYNLGEEQNMPMDEVVNQRVAVQQLLMRVAMLKSEIGTVMLISRDNNVYQYTTTTSRVNEKTLLSQAWYQGIQSLNETFFISGLHDRSYYEDQGAGAVVTLGRVLYNSNGAYAGLLLIDLDPFALLQLDHEFILTRDKYGIHVIIYNRRGEIVYHSDAASGQIPWEEWVGLKSELIGESDSKDQIRLSGSTAGGELYIQTDIPRSKLLQKINQIKGMSTVVILVSCLIVVLISFWLSHRITRPIIRLRRSMKQAEMGSYHPIEKEQTNDEIGGLVHSYNKMIRTIKALIEDVYMAEIKQRQAKLTALQNQINPHMLYNTLESIRMKALVNDDEETAGMIKILARMFRLALGKEGKRHSVKNELDYTINYLQLQNMRFDNTFEWVIDIPDEMLECSIIPLIFQPIVENSINHGFIDYSRKLTITITGGWTKDGDILFRISDNGIGMASDKWMEIQQSLKEAGTNKTKLEQEGESAEKGLGLQNISERIKLHYGNMYELTMMSESMHGTTVEILIPKT